MRTIYSADRQRARIVGIVVPVTAAIALASIYGAVVTLQSYGLHPTEGGALAPLWKRTVIASVFAAIALLAAWGLPAFLRRFVTRIDAAARPGGETFHLHRLLWPPLVVDGSDVVARGFHLGRGGNVHAPSYSLRLRDRGVLIIDPRGTVHDEDAFTRLLSGG